MYNHDHSSELDDVEGLAVATTKHLQLLKQKDKSEGSFIIEKIVGKLIKSENTRPFPLYFIFSIFLEAKNTLSVSLIFHLSTI